MLGASGKKKKIHCLPHPINKTGGGRQQAPRLRTQMLGCCCRLGSRLHPRMKSILSAPGPPLALLLICFHLQADPRHTWRSPPSCSLHLRSGWILGKSSSPRGGRALGRAPQGSGHGTELPKIKMCLDKSVGHRVGVLGHPVWSQGLDLMILVGPFQLRILYNFMIGSSAQDQHQRETCELVCSVKGFTSLFSILYPF